MGGHNHIRNAEKSERDKLAEKGNVQGQDPDLPETSPNHFFFGV
jgi:hypothetical protein